LEGDNTERALNKSYGHWWLVIGKPPSGNLGKYFTHKKNPLFAKANRGLQLFLGVFVNIYGKRLVRGRAFSF
jgi:hypothetical protein